MVGLAGIGDLLQGIGAVAGPISGLFASDKAGRAAQAGVDVSRETLAYQKALSDRLLDIMLAEQIGPGGRIKFDEAAGTITSTPDPATQRIIDASNAEELARLTTDAPRGRNLRDLYGGVATRAATEATPSGTDLAAEFRNAARGNVNEAFRVPVNALARQATRSGVTTNTGAQGALSARYANALNSALADATQRGLVLGDTLRSSAQDRGLQAAGFATNQPVGLSGAASALANRMSTARNTIPQAGGVGGANVAASSGNVVRSLTPLMNSEMYNPLAIPSLLEGIGGFLKERNVGNQKSKPFVSGTGAFQGNPMTAQPFSLTF